VFLVVGQQIQPGTPLMAIIPEQSWITANFKETQLGKIAPGQKVKIQLDAFGDRYFTIPNIVIVKPA
jgi:membrane fusion protein (multidrug efflux system)